MYVYLYISIYLQCYIYVYINIHTFTCIYIHINVCIFIYNAICMYTNKYTGFNLDRILGPFKGPKGTQKFLEKLGPRNEESKCIFCLFLARNLGFLARDWQIEAHNWHS